VKSRIRKQAILCVIHSLGESGDTSDASLMSDWLQQETSFAVGQGKPVFVCVEEGVAFSAGLLGDLEYMPFTAATLHDVVIQLIEGLGDSYPLG